MLTPEPESWWAVSALFLYALLFWLLLVLAPRKSGLLCPTLVHSTLRFIQPGVEYRDADMKCWSASGTESSGRTCERGRVKEIYMGYGICDINGCGDGPPKDHDVFKV